MKHISYSVRMLINKIVVFDVTENAQVIKERPVHQETVTVWCAFWSEGAID